MGLSSDQMASVFHESGIALERFGIKGFKKLSLGLQVAGNTVGKSFSEINEYTGEYLERQRLMGTLDKLSAAQHQKNAKEALTTTTAFSQALRMSTEEFEKQLKEQAKEVSIQEAMAGVADASQDAGQFLLNATKEISPQLQDMLKLGLKDVASLQRSSEFQDLYRTGQKELADSILRTAQGLKSGEINNENAGKSLKNLVKSVDTSSKAMEFQAMTSARTITSSIGSIIVGARELAKNLEKNGGDITAVYNKESQALATKRTAEEALGSSFENLMSTIMGESGTMTVMVNAMTSLATSLENFTTDLKTVLGGEADIATIASVVAKVVGSAAVVITAGLLVKKLMGGIGSSLLGGGGTTAPGRGSSGRGGKSGGGLGRAIGGIGAGSGLALKGLAKGFAAFANPKVAAGLAVLTGIGYLTAQVVGEFGVSLQSFNGLDSAHLIGVGEGITSIAKGIGLLGAAEVGHSFGAIFSSIGNLFSDDIFEKLDKFSTIGDMSTLARDIGPIAVAVSTLAIAFDKLKDANVESISNALAKLSYISSSKLTKVLQSTSQFGAGFFGSTVSSNNINIMAVSIDSLADSLGRLEKLNVSRIVSDLDNFDDIDSSDIKTLERLSKATESMKANVSPDTSSNATNNDKSIVAIENIATLLTEQNNILLNLTGINAGQYEQQKKSNRTTSFYKN